MDRFSGSDLQEALAQAAATLGCSVGQLVHEVVAERRGLLGVELEEVEIQAAVGSLPAVVPPPSGTTEAIDGPAKQGVDEADEDDQFEDDQDGDLDPETAEEVMELLQPLVDLLDWGLTMTVEAEEERWRVVLDGSNKDLLLEDGAKVLEAVQLLAGRMAAKAGFSRRVRVQCGTYGPERDEEIRAAAEVAASQVLETGEPVRLARMNPYERRLVHVLLNDREGVRSRSEGEGFLKVVVVERPGQELGSEGPRARSRQQRPSGRAGRGSGGRGRR